MCVPCLECGKSSTLHAIVTQKKEGLRLLTVDPKQQLIDDSTAGLELHGSVMERNVVSNIC